MRIASEVSSPAVEGDRRARAEPSTRRIRPMRSEQNHTTDGHLFAEGAPTMTEPTTLERDLPRWSDHGLANPRRDGKMPAKGTTADLLAFVLVHPGSSDLIGG